MVKLTMGPPVSVGFDPNTTELAFKTNPGTKADTTDGAEDEWLTFLHLRDLSDCELGPNTSVESARFPVAAIVLVREGAA